MSKSKYTYRPRTSFMLWIKPEQTERGAKVRQMLKVYQTLHSKRTMFDALEEMVQTVYEMHGFDKLTKKLQK